MSNTALFKEAIAEAKAVRDAAMANAKAALEETITPHLQNMLAAKLEEMASEEETTAEEVTEAVEEEVMEEEMPKSVTEEDESEEETPEEESEEEEAPEEEEETPEDESEDEMEIGEMTLPELEELINDIVAQQMQDIEDSSAEIDMTGAEEEGEPAQADIDAEELESETISMEELLAEIEEITEAAKNEEVEEGTHEEVEEEAFNEALDLAVANAGQIIGAVITALTTLGVGSMINREELKKMALPKLKAFAAKLGIGKENEQDQEETNPQELNEALETIETLKKDISETNLLNAKLLYVNKIFKANNLTESQKVNTITAFDKAETVKEVKLVFETISEGLDKTASSCVNENKGFASKAAGVAPKTITEAVETPDNSWRDRMQVLAGIKKPN